METGASRGWAAALYMVTVLLCSDVQGRRTRSTDPDASCTSEQVERCKNAAQSGRLEKLGAGGRCEKQQYVHYTHTCTLNIFLPDVDYCCCAYQKKVLCCRYHQSHDRYRCSFPEDTIATLWGGLPLKYLLPAILVPVGLVACCLVCCVKCCLHNEDCEEIRSCWRNKDKKKTLEIEETSSSPVPGFHLSNSYPSYQHGSSLQRHGGHLALGQYEREPLNNPQPNTHFHQMIMPMEQTKRPLDELMEADRLMPSAPGADELHGPGGGNGGGPYHRSASAPNYGRGSGEGIHSPPGGGAVGRPHAASDTTSGYHSGEFSSSQLPSLDSGAGGGACPGAGASLLHHPQHPAPSSHIHFLHHPHSYPGAVGRMDSHDSAVSNISAPGGSPPGGGGGGGGHAGDRGSSGCPNCAAQPPTYRESLHHPVMDTQLSHASNQQHEDPSPPYTPPDSPDKS